MITLSPAVKFTALAGVLATLVDALPAIDPSLVTTFDSMGTKAILIIGCVFLWRKMVEKDGLLNQTYKNMAETLAANKALHEKMVDTLTRIDTTVEKLGTVRTSR